MRGRVGSRSSSSQGISDCKNFGSDCDHVRGLTTVQAAWQSHSWEKHKPDECRKLECDKEHNIIFCRIQPEQSVIRSETLYGAIARQSHGGKHTVLGLGPAIYTCRAWQSHNSKMSSVSPSTATHLKLCRTPPFGRNCYGRPTE